MKEQGGVISVRLIDLPAASSILAGATLGERHAQEISAAADSAPDSPLSVLIDFTGIEAVTASYLKELLKVFFRDSGAKPRYPLVANISGDDIRYEVTSFLSERDLALQEVAILDDAPPKPRGLLGRLDSSAAETYGQLIASGPITAAELHERNPGAASGQTAWNNRLVKLWELRMAHRERVGRNWVYRTIINH